MSVVVDTPVSLPGGGTIHSPVRWRRRKSPSPIASTQLQLHQQQPHPHPQPQPQPQSQNQQRVEPAQRPRSVHLYRRSDPGLLGFMMDLELHEAGDVVDSRWDMSRTAVTTSCGLSRSMSLRNSFLRQREPLWLQSKCRGGDIGAIADVFCHMRFGG